MPWSNNSTNREDSTHTGYTEYTPVSLAESLIEIEQQPLQSPNIALQAPNNNEIISGTTSVSELRLSSDTESIYPGSRDQETSSQHPQNHTPQVSTKNTREQELKERASLEATTPPYVRWGVHWRTPVLIVLLLFFGILFSVVHHIHYSRLHGTEAVKQEWSTALGTGYAFLVVALYRAACS